MAYETKCMVLLITPSSIAILLIRLICQMAYETKCIVLPITHSCIAILLIGLSATWLMNQVHTNPISKIAMLPRVIRNTMQHACIRLYKSRSRSLLQFFSCDTMVQTLSPHLCASYSMLEIQNPYMLDRTWPS